MRFKNKTVDRIWLGMIAFSFCLWLATAIYRLGWRAVAVLFFVAFLWRRAFAAD